MKSKIAQHLLVIAGVSALLVFCMLYPFLPGGYDRFALPLATMVQVFGVVGLLLVPVGAWWLVSELRGAGDATRIRFAVASLAFGIVVASCVAMAGAATGGVSLGVLVFGMALYAAARSVRALKRSDGQSRTGFSVAPLYLVALPVLAFAAQLALATLASPVTQWSKHRAIAKSDELIRDIAAYRTAHGHYPETIDGQSMDYYPDVVGVKGFRYSRRGDSYNLYFEQPRFLLDRIGTREWVVYNPQDEQMLYSHAAWHLLRSPQNFLQNQGWYASHEAGVPHWKCFLFD